MADIRKQDRNQTRALDRDMFRVLVVFVGVMLSLVAARVAPLLFYVILLIAAVYVVRWAMEYWDDYGEGPSLREALDQRLADLPDDCVILRDLRVSLDPHGEDDEQDEAGAAPPARPLLRLVRTVTQGADESEEEADEASSLAARADEAANDHSRAQEPGEELPHEPEGPVVRLERPEGSAGDGPAEDPDPVRRTGTVTLDYLLLAPWGLFGIRLEEEEGRVWVQGGRWYRRGTAGRQVEREDPVQKVQAETRALSHFIRENWETIFEHGRLLRQVNIRPLVVFAGEEVQLEVDEQAAPVLTMDELEAFLGEEVGKTEDLVVTGVERDQLAEYLMTVH